MNSNSFPQYTLLSINRVALEVFEAGKEHTGKSIAPCQDTIK
ncbi:hypothetical protein [Myroides odoratus]